MRERNIPFHCLRRRTIEHTIKYVIKIKLYEPAYREKRKTLVGEVCSHYLTDLTQK